MIEQATQVWKYLKNTPNEGLEFRPSKGEGWDGGAKSLEAWCFDVSEEWPPTFSSAFDRRLRTTGSHRRIEGLRPKLVMLLIA